VEAERCTLHTGRWLRTPGGTQVVFWCVAAVAATDGNQWPMTSPGLGGLLCARWGEYSSSALWKQVEGIDSNPLLNVLFCLPHRLCSMVDTAARVGESNIPAFDLTRLVRSSRAACHGPSDGTLATTRSHSCTL